MNVRYSRETLHARPFYDRVVDGNFFLKMIDSMYSFVTSGIGVYGPDMRVGTNSEVMVIDVHFE